MVVGLLGLVQVDISPLSGGFFLQGVVHPHMQGHILFSGQFFVELSLFPGDVRPDKGSPVLIGDPVGFPLLVPSTHGHGAAGAAP